MAHELLAAIANEAGYELSWNQLERLALYVERLERDRERFDLTAIRDRAELVRRQVGESLQLLQVIEESGLAPGARLSDVGSGGGVPGIPIAIARPDVEVVLVESSTRKAAWLEETAKELTIHVTVVARRAEEVGRDPAHRERSDVVVAKAVAALGVLLELTIPLLKVGGLLFAPKGSRLEEEVEQAQPAIEQLAVEILGARSLGGDEDGPLLLMARKQRPTDERFPRSGAAVHKRPLQRKREKA